MKIEEAIVVEGKDYRMLITYKDNKPDKYHVVEMVKVLTFDTREECRKAITDLKFGKLE